MLNSSPISMLGTITTGKDLIKHKISRKVSGYGASCDDSCYDWKHVTKNFCYDFFLIWMFYHKLGFWYK